MFTKDLRCEVCKEGLLDYNPQVTYEMYYSNVKFFTVDDVELLIADEISQYLVFDCSNCGVRSKYTFKELEKIARKNILQRLMNTIARDELIKMGGINFSNKVLVFCGKCQGIDGKGSCLLKTYKDCKLKRLPNGL